MATITSAGAIPSTPTELRDALIAAATVISPSLTANLPASLVEDLSSTGAGALVVQDQAYVDTINSIAPTTANEQILIQLGNTYGVTRGIGANTSVYIIFSGTVGFVINTGFLVSDGTHQYQVQEPTIIPSGGSTGNIYCLAVDAGSWAIPANTVTTIASSVPAGVTLTCNNPLEGLAGEAEQSIEDYRRQVIQAGRAVATGVPTLLRTALERVSGVQARLISIQNVPSLGWEIIVGGGDPYEVANAIFQSMFNIQDLQLNQSVWGIPQTITISDYPDNYDINFVVPTQRSVTITIHWSTASGTNFVSNNVVASLVQTPIQEYINSLRVGQSISLLQLQQIFTDSVSSVIAEASIATLTFTVFVDGSPVSVSGTLFPSDKEAFYYVTSPTSITVLTP